MKLASFLIGMLIAGLVVAISAPATAPATAQQAIVPSDFSSTITNPLFPLSLVGPKVILGKEEDGDDVIETRLESRLLPRTEVIAGVTVAVWEERAYEDGELVEVALDYFAQHRDGDVYYFGEHVDNYEGGVLKNHDGQWFAGENGNLPGILMPAKPAVGHIYQQEYAPGVAEDMIMVLSINETVEVKAGLYQQCLKTLDYTPLEPGLKENKWFCPGVGMVKEAGEDFEAGLISVGPAPAQPAPTATPRPAPTSLPASQGTNAPAQSVPVITAPNTGDAGLADAADDSWPAYPLLPAIAVALLFSWIRGRWDRVASSSRG
jgi:hypothetical protein